MRQLVPARHFQRESPEDVGIQAESSIQVPSIVCRFAGVGFAAIDEEDLSRRCSIHRTQIGVLLDTFFDKGYDEVFVCMTSETMLDIVGVDDFSRIGRTNAINLSPLCRLRHNQKMLRRAFHPDQVCFILSDSASESLSNFSLADGPSKILQDDSASISDNYAH